MVGLGGDHQDRGRGCWSRWKEKEWEETVPCCLRLRWDRSFGRAEDGRRPEDWRFFGAQKLERGAWRLVHRDETALYAGPHVMVMYVDAVRLSRPVCGILFTAMQRPADDCGACSRPLWSPFCCPANSIRCQASDSQNRRECGAANQLDRSEVGDGTRGHVRPGSLTLIPGITDETREHGWGEGGVVPQFGQQQRWWGNAEDGRWVNKKYRRQSFQCAKSTSRAVSCVLVLSGSCQVSCEAAAPASVG